MTNLRLTDISEVIRSGQKKQIDVSQIKVPPYHDRTDVDDESIESLANNMSEVGQLTPILVEMKNESYYELISGLRRLDAALKLNWSSIDAIVLENLDEQSRLLLMISENAQRTDINDYDLIVSLIHLLAVSTEKSDDEVKAFLYKLKNLDSGNVKNLTFDEKQLKKNMEQSIARTDKYTIKHVVNKIRVLDFHIDIIKAMQERKLTFTYARLLNKVKDEEKMKSLLTLFVSKQIDKPEFKKEIRRILGQNKVVIPFQDTLKKLKDFVTYPEEKRSLIVSKMKEVEALIAS